MQGNQIRKNVFQIQIGCNSATTLARRCTPLSYGCAPKCQTNLAAPYLPAAIKRGGEVDGDVATVARRAVEGAMETSKSVGLRAEDMAFSIARGAIEGTRDVAGDLGATARDTIEGTVTGTQEVGGNIIEDTQRSLIRGASEVGETWRSHQERPRGGQRERQEHRPSGRGRCPRQLPMAR